MGNPHTISAYQGLTRIFFLGGIGRGQAGVQGLEWGGVRILTRVERGQSAKRRSPSRGVRGHAPPGKF